MIIRQATVDDIPGVFALLQANHKDNVVDKSNGFVTTQMSEEQMIQLITEENGVTVAEEEGRIYSFAMAGSWEFWSAWPLFQYMIEILPQFSIDGQVLTTKNSYQYGPVCVDASVRGQGIFEEVFRCSLESMANRYPYMATFINQVNPRSYAAHTRKAGMEELGKFDFNGNHYYMMGIPTK